MLHSERHQGQIRAVVPARPGTFLQKGGVHLPSVETAALRFGEKIQETVQVRLWENL